MCSCIRLSVEKEEEEEESMIDTAHLMLFLF
jgi:hypothetical protein